MLSLDPESGTNAHPGPRLDPALPRMPTLGVFRSVAGPPLTSAPAARRFTTVGSDTHPHDLFPPAVNACTVPDARWVRTDATTRASVLLYAAGSAVDNGQPAAHAGCGVAYGPGRTLALPLERAPGPITANRAVLRAAIAALTARFWLGEGFGEVVVASDSEYLVNGVCEWVAKWRLRRWKTSGGEAVKNRDLWEKLVGEVEAWEQRGVPVQFWKIKKEWNEATGAAVEGAEREAPEEFEDVIVLPF